MLKPISSHHRLFSHYPRSSQYLNLSIDTTYIDGSPVNSTGSDNLVGDDGLLVRTQFQVVLLMVAQDSFIAMYT